MWSLGFDPDSLRSVPVSPKNSASADAGKGDRSKVRSRHFCFVPKRPGGLVKPSIKKKNIKLWCAAHFPRVKYSADLFRELGDLLRPTHAVNYVKMKLCEIMWKWKRQTAPRTRHVLVAVIMGFMSTTILIKEKWLWRRKEWKENKQEKMTVKCYFLYVLYYPIL